MKVLSKIDFTTQSNSGHNKLYQFDILHVGYQFKTV